MNGQSESAMTRPTHDEGESLTLERYSAGPLEAQTRGEIDIQIATARKYARKEWEVMEETKRLATLTEEIAESMFYALPRGGKTIEGPSARLAELMSSCWGHMRSEARVVEEAETFVVSRGTSWDLQRNVAVSFEVRRRITDSNNKRYTEDMITVTANAANAIAYRNAVLRAIPKPFWMPVYNAARKKAIGGAETLVAKRRAMFEHFQKMGVVEARVLAVLDVPAVDLVSLDHLAIMKGIATAIREGDTTVDEAFPNPTGAAPIKPPARQSAAQAETQPEPEPPPPPAPVTAHAEATLAPVTPEIQAAPEPPPPPLPPPAPSRPPLTVANVTPYKRPNSDVRCYFVEFSDGAKGYTYDEALARDIEAAFKLGAEIRVKFTGQIWNGRKEIATLTVAEDV